MTKTLTQHLEAIKKAGKGIFLPYIMAGDHEKGLAVCQKLSHFWKTWVCQPLK